MMYGVMVYEYLTLFFQFWYYRDVQDPVSFDQLPYRDLETVVKHYWYLCT